MKEKEVQNTVVNEDKREMGLFLGTLQHESELAKKKDPQSNVFPMNFGGSQRKLLISNEKKNGESINKSPGVAEMLDKKLRGWTYCVRDIKQIGNFAAVTVAITYRDITREGLGTGIAADEFGIKKAEIEALQDAAGKFGVYAECKERVGNIDLPAENLEFPANPMAVSLMDLVTGKQLGIIRSIAKETGIDTEKECRMKLACTTGELSKKAASAFIGYLRNQLNEFALPQAS